MNDNDSENRTPPKPDNKERRPASEDRPTDPGERLRRLLAADDEPSGESQAKPEPGETGKI
jgi:hypothetical protein